MTRISKLSVTALSAAILAACGGGGGGGGGTVTPPPPPPADTTAPTVSFSPTTLSVDSGQTGTSTVSASDNVGVTSGPNVSCDNGGSFSGSTFTAPTTETDVTVTCTATASDAAGNQGSATLTVDVTGVPIDSEAPVVTFDPSTANAMGGELVNINLTATDNVGVTTGPTATCDNGGDFFNNQFTAPDVSVDTTVTCTGTAEDAAGNIGTATLTVQVTPAPDVLAPLVSFNPTTLTVASEGTGSSVLSATDDRGVTVGPNVTCDNGGSFANNTFTAPATNVELTVTCTATAEDAAGNSGQDVLTVTVAAAGAKVTISGNVTFDFVPHSNVTNGLDYANTSQRPVRGATVEALDGSDAVLDTTQTDASGNYSVNVDLNTDVRIRVKSELVQTGTASWDVKVTDNTNNHNVYAMQGGLTSSGAANSTRDLNAASGWGGSDYTSSRVAAPFAIMDPIYTAIQKFVAVDSTVNFPAMEFRWSTSNTSGGNGSAADLAAGRIGTSSYIGNGTSGNVYILGDANNDTDEYDRHVVVHEWGHYFEDRMSRSDSVGGGHSLSNRLDMRVAMGEGWGNALSGMILDDPVYRDSLGAGQGSGFNFSVESNTHSTAGWYNEGSAQSIIYDVYDSAADGADNLSLGLGPIYETLTATSYTGSPAFTSIFLFLNELKSQQAGSATDIDAISAAQSISGTDEYGAGETNNGTVLSSLPVYKTVTVGGGAVEICSVDDQGNYNKLGNRAFLKLNIPTSGSYTITMTRKSGATGRDPDFYLFQAGSQVAKADAGTADSDTFTGTLQAGDYSIDAHDWNNVGSTGVTPGDACYDFSVN